jgi:hypothetical protein
MVTRYRHMIRVLSRIVLVGCMMSSGLLEAGVQLRLKGGLQGKEEDSGLVVTVIAEGDEYTLQVVCEGISEKAHIQGIDKIPHFIVSQGGTSSSMTMINGKTKHTSTYTYAVQPLKAGAYTVGPVLVDDAGTVSESNTIAVRVVTPAVYDQFAGKKGAARQALGCRMQIAEHEVYVGQPAVVTVTIEDDGQVHDRGLQAPEFGSLQAQPIEKPFSEQKLINGQLKVITTQQYSVSADTPGTYTIEPAVAHFLVPDEDRDMMGGLLGSFFGPSGKKRSIRSNSSILAVKPLPMSTEPVDAVGHIASVAMQIQKSVLELNEPCVLTYTVVGSCNFDALISPTLNVPEVVSVYPSTTQYTPEAGAANTGKKVFEYIVQIGESGEHHIPSQRFVYFDVSVGAYKTITTNECLVTVKQPKVVAAAPQQPESGATLQTQKSGNAAPVFTETSHVPLLPWWVIGVLVLLSVLGIFYDLWMRLGVYLLELFGITSIVKRERHALKQLLDAQAIEQIHVFFVTVLMRLWRCHSQMIDGEYVREMLRSQDVDSETADACAAYMDACSQAAFAPHMVKESVKTDLLHKASFWYEFFIRVQRKG